MEQAVVTNALKEVIKPVEKRASDCSYRFMSPTHWNIAQLQAEVQTKQQELEAWAYSKTTYYVYPHGDLRVTVPNTKIHEFLKDKYCSFQHDIQWEQKNFDPDLQHGDGYYWTACNPPENKEVRLNFWVKFEAERELTKPVRLKDEMKHLQKLIEQKKCKENVLNARLNESLQSMQVALDPAAIAWVPLTR